MFNLRIKKMNWERPDEVILKLMKGGFKINGKNI